MFLATPQNNLGESPPERNMQTEMSATFIIYQTSALLCIFQMCGMNTEPYVWVGKTFIHLLRQTLKMENVCILGVFLFPYNCLCTQN